MPPLLSDGKIWSSFAHCMWQGYPLLISKCDLLAERDIESVFSYTHRVLREQLGFVPEVTPVSSVDSWAARVDGWFQRTIWPLLQRAKQSLAGSVQRKVQFLQDSLLVSLETRSGQVSSAVGRSNREGNLAESLFRPLDEQIQVFKRRWEACFEGISDWTDRLLEVAALMLAEDSGAAEETSSSGAHRLSSVTLEELDQHCQAFLREYIDLGSGILDAIRKMQAETSKSEIWYEPQRTPALPAPVLAPLESLSLGPPGRIARLSHSGRVNFFRKELDERARAALQEVLNEYRPRLTRWFRATLALLEQSYRIQTDPYRYLVSSGRPAEPQRPLDLLYEDLRFLRGEVTPEREPDRSSTTLP